MAFGAAVLTAIIDASRGDVGMTASGRGNSMVGAAALVASALVYSLFRVRTTVHLRAHPASRLNLARMCWMGGISALMLLVDVALGGPSAATLRRVGHVKPAQWALMALGVFISGFLSASLQFEAMRTITAAKAQPFAALQPLFAGLFGFAALREPVSAGTAVGGLLMVGAALLACGDREAAGAAQTDAAESAVAVEEPGLAEAHAVSALPPLISPLDAIEGEMLGEMVHPPPPPAAKPKPKSGTLSAAAVAAALAVVAKAQARKRRV
jgi:uncharacterized membrane protein